MNALTDQQLLREYAERRTEAAFAELVRRHVDLVYSTAVRLVRDSHLAQDVTQGVFVALAANGSRLVAHPILSGWLHRTACNLAAKTVRSEVRRRAREHEATVMNVLLGDQPDALWHDIAPQLDAAMGELSEADRDVLLLRYFERKSAQEMAVILGSTAEAAQKRLNRAVERLREWFAQRGLTIGAAALTAGISANAVQVAPAGLAAMISATAVTGALVSSATLISATKTIAMTTLQKAVIGVTLAVAVGAGLYQARQAIELRRQNQALQQQQAPLLAQVQQLQRERDAAAQRLAAVDEAAVKSGRNDLELMKLRNEVVRLRRNQDKTSAGTDAVNNDGPVKNDIGAELGNAIIHGDTGALKQLMDEYKLEQQTVSAGEVGLSDAERDKLAAWTFQPMRTAFKIIEDAANQGNQAALQALTSALDNSDLRDLAVGCLGRLAANGDQVALNVLVNPEKYGVLLSSTIAALQPAADSGNQTAINALAAIANNAQDQNLWFLATKSLAQAAAAGNNVAISALVNMSATTNRAVRYALSEALTAMAPQNAKAAEALRAMGQP